MSKLKKIKKTNKSIKTIKTKKESDSNQVSEPKKGVESNTCKTCVIRENIKKNKNLVLIGLIIIILIGTIILFSPKKEKNLLCELNEKPIIRMYSTNTCSHCNWVSPAFEETVQKYVSEEKIIAHHWKWIFKDNELVGVDDVLTPEFEGILPVEEKKIFEELNSRGAVPFFAFGCEETRLGTIFERENDLEAEKKDFELMIERVLNKTSGE